MARHQDQAIRLARALRELRESARSDRQLTQAQLANAFSKDGQDVAAATLASWESLKAPKAPSEARISAYARFFCTPRSLEGEAHLIPDDQLTSMELDRFRQLESDLLRLLNAEEREVRRTFQFEAGPVIVICPEVPDKMRGPLADEKNTNVTRMQKYGDLDALIELYGHLRAENPTLEVSYRLASNVASSDLSRHVILLGGIGWNEVTRSIQGTISQVPITQTAVDDLRDGDIFCVRTPDGELTFYPQYRDLGDGKELIADVAFVARLRNPFKINRTLTICNGIFSRGVLGSVLCLTDVGVRVENEKYLAERFPGGEFAMLLRVPVVNNETLAPDLQNPDVRLYEWEPGEDARKDMVPNGNLEKLSTGSHARAYGVLVGRATGEVDK